MTQFSPYLHRLVELALDEDIGHGDLTTTLTIPAETRASGHFLAKEPLVLAGCQVAELVFQRLDPSVSISWQLAEGQKAEVGTHIAELSGPAQSLLIGERTALNFLQRLSGIATFTRSMVELVDGCAVKLLDTRKTTPGWRGLEKAAVRAGGGHNHRFALDSGVMIKDNHIVAAGSIAAAVERVRRTAPQLVRIEVEVKTLEELDQALACDVDIIMLDNMSPDLLRRCVELCRGHNVITEASGGINERTLRQVAETGVDSISMGALTHSAPSVDISLEFV